MSRIQMSRIPGWTKASSLALKLALFAGVAVCAQLDAPAWAGVIYVKANATGAKNGHSWANAYTNPQAALAAAVSGDEIWVAQGTYKPTSSADRTVSFVMKSGVGLYGGFAGTETQRDQRNWETNATTLSGDIGTAGNAEDNTYRVVVGAQLAVLDGFTITGGNANGSGSFYRGGGMYNEKCSPTVANCTFSSNMASSEGGGMYNYQSSPTVTNCTFSGNTAGTGGGMYNTSSSPTVTNCTFSGNGAMLGGGMYSTGGSPTVTNCTFSGNMSAGGGGGMYNKSSSPIVTNCTFSGNTANGGGTGGGGMYNWGRSPTMTNCIFSGNEASDGGGMLNDESSPTLTNCTFSGNTASGIYGFGGGMDNYSGSPTVTNCTFSGNTARVGGGGMYNTQSSPTMTNSIFWDNTAPSGAEIYKDSTTTPTFSHCDITGCGGSGASWDTALGTDGGGNIAADPRFVAPATPAGTDGLWRTSDDGLRLQSDSPCIGAADPAVAPGTDILGLPRSSPPDIGAYEFPSGGYCTLTYNTGPGGSISGTTPQTVDHGTSGTAVEAVPSIGHHFVQWSDASTANPRTDTNVTTDVSVTATFAINTYTLTYNAGADGSISGATPQTVDYGADGSEVTAVPDTGHRFVQWSDDSTANPRKDTNVTADINVTAVFAPLAAVRYWSLYE